MTRSPTAEKQTPQESPRILIVRLSAIGDVVQSMSVACALRDRFPTAFLAWVVGEPGGTLLRGHRALDEVIPLPRGWLKSPKAVWQLRRRLRAMRFDTAIDAQGLTKSAIIARLSGARRRLGFGDPWGREMSRWFNNETVDTTAVHVVDRNMQLLRPLGIDASPVRFDVPELPADRESAERYIHENNLGDGFAIINTGAGWPSKLWPGDRHAAVAIHLGQCRNLPTVVIGGNDAERAMAEQIVARSEGHARLAPPMTLPELAAVMRRGRLFVGSDTGPLHLAAAVGTPCVGLHGPFPAEKHGPYGPGHIALQKMHFTGSTRQRRNASSQCMEAITINDVCEACDQLLQRDGQEAA